MQLLSPEPSLSSRVVRGGLWVFGLRIVEIGLGIIKLIILARLLAPDDFGLFGIALLAISTLETFSQTGSQTALIQKKGDVAGYLDTAWTVSAIRGIVLFIILLISAPYVAVFFKSPEASLIIQAIGVTILFRGFTNIGIIYFQKELEFNRQFIYGLVNGLVEFVVVVTAALILKDVWALVIGQIAVGLVSLVVSYLIHPYRPSIHLDLKKSKELFGFGRWVFGSSILAFLLTQGDDIFVGKMLGITALGFYQMAYRISNMPATEITHVISQVTFPAYSKMQNNLPRLRESFLRVLQLTAFLSFPIAGLIFVLAPDFTKIFLGDKWMPMVPAMQVLALWGGIRSIGATTGSVFFSMGKPKILTKIQFGHLILLAILIYPLSMRWGIFGTSLAVIFATLIPVSCAFYIVIKVIKCKIENFCKITTLPLINTVIMVSVIFILKTHWSNTVEMLEIFLFILFGIVSYLGVTYLFDKFFSYGMRDIFRGSLLEFRGK